MPASALFVEYLLVDLPLSKPCARLNDESAREPDLTESDRCKLRKVSQSVSQADGRVRPLSPHT